MFSSAWAFICYVFWFPAFLHHSVSLKGTESLLIWWIKKGNGHAGTSKGNKLSKILNLKGSWCGNLPLDNCCQKMQLMQLSLIILFTYWIEANFPSSRLSVCRRATHGIWKSSGKGDFHRFGKAFSIVFGSSHIWESGTEAFKDIGALHSMASAERRLLSADVWTEATRVLSCLTVKLLQKTLCKFVKGGNFSLTSDQV